MLFAFLFVCADVKIFNIHFFCLWFFEWHRKDSCFLSWPRGVMPSKKMLSIHVHIYTHISAFLRPRFVSLRISCIYGYLDNFLHVIYMSSVPSWKNYLILTTFNKKICLVGKQLQRWFQWIKRTCKNLSNSNDHRYLKLSRL